MPDINQRWHCKTEATAALVRHSRTIERPKLKLAEDREITSLLIQNPDLHTRELRGTISTKSNLLITTLDSVDGGLIRVLDLYPATERLSSQPSGPYSTNIPIAAGYTEPVSVQICRTK